MLYLYILCDLYSVRCCRYEVTIDAVSHGVGGAGGPRIRVSSAPYKLLPAVSSQGLRGSVSGLSLLCTRACHVLPYSQDNPPRQYPWHRCPTRGITSGIHNKIPNWMANRGCCRLLFAWRRTSHRYLKCQHKRISLIQPSTTAASSGLQVVQR